MGAKSFDMLMTRVPTIGEEINREDRSYLVIRVQHEPIDSKGTQGWAGTPSLKPSCCNPMKSR